MDLGIFKIQILGQQDELIGVHGDGEGDHGIYLSEDGVDTLLTAAPEKQTWKTGARQKGSKPRNRKILHKDIDLEFLIMETESHPYEYNESYLEQAIGYELDPFDDDAKYARVAVTTDISGTRYLDIVQYEEPEFSPKIDPIKQQFAHTTLKVRCGDPDWYEDDWISACDFTADGEGFVEVWNPTPRVMFHSWVATQGKWTIPDFSWRGPPNARVPGGKDQFRYVTSPPITEAHGVMRVNVRGGPRGDKLMIEDINDTNILALFAGQFFFWTIPPYTQRQKLLVRWEDTEDVGTGRIELRQPRRWSRAWGQQWLG